MIKASNVLAAAQKLLIDEDAVRWSVSELATWLNEALLQLADDVPTATAAAVALSLIEGPMQQLPEDVNSLLSPVANVTADDEGNITAWGRRVTPTDAYQLDCVEPQWRNPRYVRRSAEARHVVLDRANPRIYWVYPANDGTGKVMMNVSKKVVFDASSNDIADYEEQVNDLIPDDMEAALTNYVAFRAFSKDSQTAGAANLAASYHNLYMEQVGRPTVPQQGVQGA